MQATDFNDAAAKKDAAATRKILDAITKTRLNLGLHDAITRGDWDAAAALAEKGADPMHRSNAALSALNKNDTPGAQRLAEKIKIPSYYREQRDGPFVLAAKNGNRATVDDMLARGEAKPASLSRALAAALEGGQAEIAGLLLEKIPAKDITDTALGALLIHRPEIYDAAIAGRADERKTMPDFIGHFYRAAGLNNHAAMEKALGLMIAHKSKLSLYTMMGGDGEMDPGGPYSDIGYVTLATGHEPVIDRFIANFSRELPQRVTLMHMAAGMSDDYPDLLQHLGEKLGATEGDARSVLLSLGRGDYTGAAKYFLASWKEVVKENPTPVLAILAGGKDANLLINTVDGEGIALPSDDKARARILSAAIDGKSRDAEDWLLARIGEPSPGLIKELQQSQSYAVQKRAADLGKTMRFSNDSLFWTALREGERAVVDAFPREPKISTETPWRIGAALEDVIKSGDMTLFRDILLNSEWTDLAKKQVFRASLKSQQALELLAETGFLPPKLEDMNLHEIAAGGGGATLDWLASKGVGIGDAMEREALRLAIHKNAAGLIEHLMAKGVDPAKEATPMASAIDYGANAQTLDTLEKWMTRGEVLAAPGIKDEIAAAENPFEKLFGGEDSLAVRAAYADSFAAVMKKAVSTPGFNIDLLVQTKDKHGNTLLEILGAHGKLNDILDPPLAWKNRDAVSFIEQNTPKPYHAQVDYNPLKAALDLMNLQARGKDKRFKLG